MFDFVASCSHCDDGCVDSNMRFLLFQERHYFQVNQFRLRLMVEISFANSSSSFSQMISVLHTDKGTQENVTGL